jgi:ribosomal protein S18 acetylase RimI-like enzyme
MQLMTRPAGVEDAELVHGLIQAAFEEYRDTVPVLPGALNETLDEVRARVAEGRTLLVFNSSGFGTLAGLANAKPGETVTFDLMAMLDTFTEPVGTIAYEPREGYMYVGRVAVHPEWRRQGIGRMLMQHIEEMTPPLGLTRLRLGTRESMPTNVAFYESLGYRIVEREPHSRGPDTLLWFEKELERVPTPAKLVQERAVILGELPGKRLKSVRYWCLPRELSRSEIDSSMLHLGGEVEIVFEDIGPLFFSWVRTGFRSPHYCIGIQRDSYFARPELLRRFGAGQTSLWKPFIGKRLKGISLISYDPAPYVIRFAFETGSVYIGSGSDTTGDFADLEAVLLRSESEWQRHHAGPEMRVLWEKWAARGEERQ